MNVPQKPGFRLTWLTMLATVGLLAIFAAVAALWLHLATDTGPANHSEWRCTYSNAGKNCERVRQFRLRLPQALLRQLPSVGRHDR